MNERLSWDEVKKRYPNEWVCLIDVDWPDTGDVRSGIVYAHDPKHNELLKKQRGLRSAAIVWTGKIRGRIHLIEEPVGSQDAVDQQV